MGFGMTICCWVYFVPVHAVAKSLFAEMQPVQIQRLGMFQSRTQGHSSIAPGEVFIFSFAQLIDSLFSYQQRQKFPSTVCKQQCCKNTKKNPTSINK